MDTRQVEPGPGHGYPRRAVDARVLDAGTALRFALLLLLILAGSVSMLNEIAGAYLSGVVRTSMCMLASGLDPSADPVRNAVSVAPVMHGFVACMSSYESSRLRWTLLGIGLVLALAFAIYRWIPAWKTPRRRLGPAAALRAVAP